MLEFKLIKYDSSKKCLNITVKVKDLPYYNGITIEGLVIDNQDTYLSSGPSEEPILKVDYSNQNLKEVTFQLYYKQLGLEVETNMLFIYALAKGTPAPDTPCGKDNVVTMAVYIPPLKSFYSSFISQLNEIEDSCCIPKNFIDSYLKLKALTLCVNTQQLPLAVRIWNKFFTKTYISNGQSCKCSG